MKHVTILSTVAIATFGMAGCASVAVTDDAIRANTATALHVAPESLTITNRTNQGVKTSYLASTSNGHQYSCYVTGGVSMVGRVVSDAVCADAPKAGNVAASTTPATAAATTSSSSTCNALLKAAGKCQ